MLLISITPEQFEARKVTLHNNGVKFYALSPNEGTASSAGVEVKYLYDGTKLLTLTVMSRPFLVAQSAVESVIRKWFES